MEKKRRGKRRRATKGDKRARARTTASTSDKKRGAGASCVSGGKYCGAINVTDKRAETTNKFFDG